MNRSLASTSVWRVVRSCAGRRGRLRLTYGVHLFATAAATCYTVNKAYEGRHTTRSGAIRWADDALSTGELIYTRGSEEADSQESFPRHASPSFSCSTPRSRISSFIATASTEMGSIGTAEKAWRAT